MYMPTCWNPGARCGMWCSTYAWMDVACGFYGLVVVWDYELLNIIVVWDYEFMFIPGLKCFVWSVLCLP